MVRFWTADGTMVLADETRLVGASFPLSKVGLWLMANRIFRAEVTDLQDLEKRFEGGPGSLLEVPTA